MNKIYLPTLISIHIKNFSLFPHGLDYKYNFVKGVNLIIGGNGLGKTTFVNLIKYGLIGLYKKDLGFIRTYLGESRENRRSLPVDYFSSRMDPHNQDRSASVVLSFKINDVFFETTRGLYDIELRSVKVKESGKEYALSGSVMSQSKYDRLNDNEKEGCLQFSYESLMAKKANLYSFDDFIFFINEILFFGENHKTILWDDDNDLIQERLSSKYFNDPQLDNQREEASRKAKYHDSLARHNSEDMRAINKVIESVKFENKPDNDLKVIVEKAEKTKSAIKKQQEKLDSIHSEREKLVQNHKLMNAERNKLSRHAESIDIKIKQVEKKAFQKIWHTLNPKYDIYLQNIRLNSVCPMCNRQIASNRVKKILDSGDICFSCDQKLLKTEGNSEYNLEIKSLQGELTKIYERRQAIEAEVIRSENKIEELDVEYREKNDALFNLINDQRNLEHSLNTDSKTNESFELKAMLHQISELKKKKIENETKSKNEKEMADEITGRIEKYNAKITRELSNYFSEFAEKFIGVQSSLTYEDFNDGRGKRFVPVIDGKPRLDSQSLSESQRFFIDHSYRMSLLHFFYQQPTFFICETPDSSLDISYEKNAANVFLKFLDQPNILILTSNLNNSEFLDYMVERAPKINYVNLLEIGKRSPIQSASKDLDKIFNRIKGALNARHAK